MLKPCWNVYISKFLFRSHCIFSIFCPFIPPILTCPLSQKGSSSLQEEISSVCPSLVTFSCSSDMFAVILLMTEIFIKPARKGFYWQTELPQWEGGRLFDMSAGSFYGNSCNSGTESRKIVSKVGN